jgi:hypothetical protein
VRQPSRGCNSVTGRWCHRSASPRRYTPPPPRCTMLRASIRAFAKRSGSKPASARLYQRTTTQRRHRQPKGVSTSSLRRCPPAKHVAVVPAWTPAWTSTHPGPQRGRGARYAVESGCRGLDAEMLRVTSVVMMISNLEGRTLVTVLTILAWAGRGGDQFVGALDYPRTPSGAPHAHLAPPDYGPARTVKRKAPVLSHRARRLMPFRQRPRVPLLMVTKGHSSHSSHLSPCTGRSVSEPVSIMITGRPSKLVMRVEFPSLSIPFTRKRQPSPIMRRTPSLSCD